MRTVLLVGFGPFPGAPKNPSAELVRAIARKRRPALAHVRILDAVLPTSYVAVATELPELLRRHDPDLVLFFGLATRDKFLRIESRAVNAASFAHPDATRAKAPSRILLPGGAPELRVLAPLRKMVAAARSAGIVARHSRDAGRYICNAALFTTLHSTHRTGRPPQVAFIHIPWPRRHGRRHRPTASALVRAGQAALVAFIAANPRS
jgi:pyroglutamyl-peptidase